MKLVVILLFGWYKFGIKVIFFQKKVDNSRQSGAEGGPQCRLTEIDELVLSIIGRESPAVQGLLVTESSVLPGLRLKSCVVSQLAVQQMSFTAENSVPAEYTILSDTTNVCPGTLGGLSSEPFIPAWPTPRRKRTCQETQEDIFMEKEKLLVENLRLRNKKLRIEIAMLKLTGAQVGVNTDSD